MSLQKNVRNWRNHPMSKLRKRKKEEHEEHIDESWLIPYADLLTLLLALFIILYASSTINQEKYRSIMESFQSELNGTGVSEKKHPSPPTPYDPQPGTEMELKGDKKQLSEPEPAQGLDQLKQQLEAYITEKQLQDVISLQDTERGVEISLKDVVLFDSGKSDLKENSFKTLNYLTGLLNRVPNAINIEGHTDNVPIRSSTYPSNWELSAARAASVLHYFESQQVAPGRMQFTGFGEHRPLQPNDTIEHRQANRRVTIVIIRGS